MAVAVECEVAGVEDKVVLFEDAVADVIEGVGVDLDDSVAVVAHHVANPVGLFSELKHGWPVGEVDVANYAVFLEKIEGAVDVADVHVWDLKGEVVGTDGTVEALECLEYLSADLAEAVASGS